jgi:hypothetical protein
MDKNFVEFVRSSCCDAVTKDSEYMVLQSKLAQAEKDRDIEAMGEYNCRMEIRAEEVCFTAGWNAAIQFCLKGATI